ncbi:hypothetical protein H0H81_004584 [Sphagnurus paluster]|uniref:Uncharacterized protein n=1 Tax=Sphagnurus paluster TaxID=117069 RepID=A0A9P7K2F0_9AGAR|nr:hypothetical protein H0H81_004584 [Sphagnurus paluster]
MHFEIQTRLLTLCLRGLQNIESSPSTPSTPTRHKSLVTVQSSAYGSFIPPSEDTITAAPIPGTIQELDQLTPWQVLEMRFCRTIKVSY